MDLASADKLVLGSIAFAVFWLLAVFPSVPFLPIGRTAGSLLGAILMIVFQVMTPDKAYDAVDLSVLGLLFGTMVVGLYLERADMFKYLGQLLSWKCQGAKDLLCRICIVSALSSALFTNDTSCIVLTEFVLRTAKQNNVPPHPFLLALASSANIGSSATPIGNPQNLVIAIQSKISFGQFLLGLFPSMLVGVFINMLILLGMYWRLLSAEQVVEIALEEGNLPKTVITPIDMPSNSTEASPVSEEKSPSLDGNIGDEESGNTATTSAMNEPNDSTETTKDTSSDGANLATQSVQQKQGLISPEWKRLFTKICAYLVTLGMLIALLMGLDMSWTVITASLILIVLDFKDAGPCLDKVKKFPNQTCLNNVVAFTSKSFFDTNM